MKATSARLTDAAMAYVKKKNLLKNFLMERKDLPTLLAGTSSVSYEISFAVVFLYYEYVISRVVSTVKR